MQKVILLILLFYFAIWHFFVPWNTHISPYFLQQSPNTLYKIMINFTLENF